MRPRAALLALALVAALTPAAAAPPTPRALGAADVDRMLAVEWRRHHLTAGPLVDDARFLRRVTLDLTGTVPSADAVRAFLADHAADKRGRVVDELLQSRAYALHWASYWDRMLMGRVAHGNVVDRVAFARWLYRELERNRPWNELVLELVSATGQNTLGGVKKNALGPLDEPEPDPSGVVHPAVNWLLRYNGNPTDLTGKLSRTFLGVQIQCAQCHNHPSEKWKQDDFRGLAACFARTGLQPLEDKAKGQVRKVELRDLPRNTIGGGNPELQKIAAMPPRALDGTRFSDDGKSASAGPPAGAPSRRLQLARWLVKSDNPWFARAVVNRYWAHLVGRGFVEPIDDFRASNPVAAPAVLDALAADFVAHGYDVKRLIRTITATRAYQLAVVAGKPGEWDEKLFVHHRMRPLTSEELLNSLLVATNLENALAKAGMPNLEQLKAQIQGAFDFLFSVDEEAPPPADFAGSIQQALLFLNSRLVERAASAVPGMALAGILDFPASDADKITALYLRTLSRLPTAEETRRLVAFVNAPREVVAATPRGPVPPAERGGKGKGKGKGKNKNPLAALERAAGRLDALAPTPEQQAYEDVFWALLNSSEFIFQH